jgi:hypothetical protein
MKWIDLVNNGSTTLCKVFDSKGNQIAEIRCLQSHREEILDALEAYERNTLPEKVTEK